MGLIDVERVLEHLRVKWAGRPCPMCGVGAWNVEGIAYEIRQFGAGKVVTKGPVIPLVPVVCTNCGNTVLVSAMVAGLVGAAPR